MNQPHKARKRFGQNFLTDEGVIDGIVRRIAPRESDLLIEIGPGQAALTRPLMESGARLILVEIDRDLAQVLNTQFAGNADVTVVNIDALKADFSELSEGQPFRLVGNLPYNISTPLIFHVLGWSALIRDMHFMLQQEVVRRMAAEPGTKAWGKLSVMCQYFCKVEPLMEVPPEAFSPRPKVQSSIVRLTPHEKPPVAIANMERFELILQRAFSMRRKTLRNALKAWLSPEQIEQAGLNPGQRPETVDLAGFAALAALSET